MSEASKLYKTSPPAACPLQAEQDRSSLSNCGFKQVFSVFKNQSRVLSWTLLLLVVIIYFCFYIHNIP